MQAHSFLTHTLNPQIGSKGQNIPFVESRHDAYQTVGNGTQSTMHTHILSLHTTSTLSRGERSNHFFLKVVTLHIKLMGMEEKEPCKHILCPTPPEPGLGQKVKHSFIESSHVAYQIKGFGT